ncbi:MAG TPA: 2Fe-2S iron-sulfur cluster-binding protein [Polyangiaceae bacterium]|nr:2Fe-2S iron-sulfur cluster-binding protein [Polyangiaceae bacterium]
MPTIEFEGNALGPTLRVDEPEGGALADICDDCEAPVPFSCRGASCATCRVVVLEGGALFEAPGEAERELLEVLGAGPDERLACSARVRAGGGLVRLRVADESVL